MTSVNYPEPEMGPPLCGTHAPRCGFLTNPMRQRGQLGVMPHGVEHSSSRRAHLGWALDVVDLSGLRIQLHTPEVISADDE